MTGLVVHEIGHIASYSLIYFIFVLILKPANYKLKMYLVGLVATLFIDADHSLDYLIATGFKFKPDYLFTNSYFELNKKVIVFLHSYELILATFIFGIIAKTKKVKLFLFSIALGMLVHVLFDVVYYNFNWYVYFITYRLINNFDISIFNV